jgi:hypothetical protein
MDSTTSRKLVAPAREPGGAGGADDAGDDADGRADDRADGDRLDLLGALPVAGRDSDLPVSA